MILVFMGSQVKLQVVKRQYISTAGSIEPVSSDPFGVSLAASIR
jgi:hypothetical protein